VHPRPVPDLRPASHGGAVPVAGGFADRPCGGRTR